MKQDVELLHQQKYEEMQNMDAVDKAIGMEPGPPSETILEEAGWITSKDRNETYGNPGDNLSNTADLWSSYLNRKYGDIMLDADDVCMMMILLKISRQAHAPKRDNLVDICGWARLVEVMDE